MISLSRHIEALLLDHDCVIVPTLGGFVTHYVSASYVPDEQMFLPPYRTVGFNSQLTLNDGLLVQSCMNANDSSYPEATKMVDMAVAAIKRELQSEGQYEFEGIGTLHLNLDGDYDFRPNETGVLSPALYGLAPFESPLAPIDEAHEEKTSPEKSEPAKPKKTYTISVNRELCNYVAAVVAALIFYFMWATPIAPTSGNREPIVAAAPIPFSTVAPSAKEMQTKTAKTTSEAEHRQLSAKGNAEAINATSAAITNTAERTEKPTTSPVSAKTQAEEERVGKYTIVLASCVPLHNAERYVAELQSEGLKDVKVQSSRRMVRVVHGLYADEGEAYRALRHLRSDSHFSDAWVMAVKK